MLVSLVQANWDFLFVWPCSGKISLFCSLKIFGRQSFSVLCLSVFTPRMLCSSFSSAYLLSLLRSYSLLFQNSLIFHYFQSEFQCKLLVRESYPQILVWLRSGLGTRIPVRGHHRITWWGALMFVIYWDHFHFLYLVFLWSAAAVVINK